MGHVCLYLFRLLAEVIKDKVEKGSIFSDQEAADPVLILRAFICGYFFAWLSHAFVERNKPATFTYPLWSLRGDIKMWFEILTGQHRLI
mmetsp:Transcript_7069/g.11907  ORF Transcript_7069/g.11907 Transcript_7069/m.11907 type:complete len:89 (+) Transcript_7069:169-435(+)